MRSVREAIATIGETRGRSPQRQFGIRQRDRLFHTYVIGQTGTGKSTFLLGQALQDHRNGHGFCLIDPHGDLAEVVRGGVGDTCVYWDVADPDCAFGYNPITRVSERHRPLVASGLIEALKKQWADSWGARMEHLLRFSILALLEVPNSSMADIVPMLLDREFRREALQSVTDSQVREFWTKEYPAMNYKTAVDGVAPIANKLGAFLAHPLVRKAVCEPERPLRFRKIMDEGQCLIVNLAKGRLGGDTANVLGGLVVSGLVHAAYSRQVLTEPERRPFFIYIDEFHSLTTETLADALPELRKYRVGMVLAHQHVAQIGNELFESILGNVGNIIVYRVGAADAPVLARHLAGDVPTTRDLLNLPNYEFYTRIMVDREKSRPFSARTLSPDMLVSDS